MKRTVPRLSICIPTFQRAELLNDCLATVLPQIEPWGDEVECVLSDNASTDGTAGVIAEYGKRFPLRSFRNRTNIGILGNITKTVTQLARGEYALVLGDDDAMMAGAVERIVRQIRRFPTTDLLALNIGYLDHTRRPATEALYGGVKLSPEKCLRSGQPSGQYTVEQLLSGPCADFTASYSLILRRQAWCTAFPTPHMDTPFTCVRDTYPHAFIIATTMINGVARLISEPSIMVFEMPAEQFSWSRYRAINGLVRATELLQLYEQHGVSRKTLSPYYQHQLEHRALFLGDLLWSSDCAGGWREAARFAWMQKRFPVLLGKAFLVAMLHPEAPRGLRSVAKLLQRTRNFVRRR